MKDAPYTITCPLCDIPTEDPGISHFDGEEQFWKQDAIATLMLDERVFALAVKTHKGMELFLSLRHIDCTSALIVLEPDDVEPVYRAWRENNSYGIEIWYCKKHNLPVNYKMERDLKEDGLWDNELRVVGEK